MRRSLILVPLVWLSLTATANCFEPFWTRVVSLAANSSLSITIYDQRSDPPHEWIRFMTVGLHSQRHEIAVHRTDNNTTAATKTLTGFNIGLVLMADTDDGTILVSNYNSRDFNVMIAVNSHRANDPIPGACNQEFQLEISPFIRLYRPLADPIDSVDRLEYQLSNIGVPDGYSPPDCPDSQYLIRYDLYAYYMSGQSESAYFRALRLMSNESTIRRYAVWLEMPKTSPRTRAHYYSYPGRGVVYTIIARSQGFSSAYVPVATYNCDDFDACGELDLFGKIVASIVGVIGLTVCCRGHLWFRLQVLFFGFINGCLVTEVLLVRYVSWLGDDERAIYTLSVGSIAAVVWLLLWRIIDSPFLTLLLSGISLGILVAATLLFTSVGNLDAFQSDINYWVVIGCTALVLTMVLMIINAVLLSILSTSVVGAYATVAAVDRIVNGSLAYIIINVIKRAAYDYDAVNNPPFDSKDVILAIMWSVLSALGVCVQLYHSMHRSPPFPPPSACYQPHGHHHHHQQRRLHEHESHYRGARRTPRFCPMPASNASPSGLEVINERSPLLRHHSSHHTNNNGHHFDYRSKQQAYDRPPPPATAPPAVNYCQCCHINNNYGHNYQAI